MSVHVLLPNNNVDGDVKAFDAAGKEIAVPHRLEISPYFYQPKQMRPALYLTVKAGDTTTGRAVIYLSGSNGGLRLTSLQQRCEPMFERVASKPATLPLSPRKSGRQSLADVELDQ